MMTTIIGTLPAGLLDRKQAAASLAERGYKTASATLAKLAGIGRGPAFRSFGRKPLYLALDLIASAEAKIPGPWRSTRDPGTVEPSGRDAVL
jgi:hypothetical protein